jgi:AcrR family transcriptional regulator
MSDSSTRERILDEAERLFAERGFDATSLRAITAAAGVNLAAVNYHFGSKQGLLREAMRRRIEPVNAERLRRLDAAIERAGGGVPAVREIIDAFVRPAVEAFVDVEPTCFMGMVRLLYSGEVGAEFFRDLFGPVVQRFAILQEALPGVSAAELSWRFHFMVGGMVQAFNPRVRGVHPHLVPLEAHVMVDLVVGWATAGFLSPPVLAHESTSQNQELRS